MEDMLNKILPVTGHSVLDASNRLLVRPPPNTLRNAMCVDGWIECSVVDHKTQKVIRTYPKQHNLVLNSGLDYWCNTYSLALLFAYAVAGTGTTVTSIASTPSTASQSGTTVTVTVGAGSFGFTSTAVDAGRMIKWDSGEEAMIVTVASATQATVTPSQAVSEGEFNYYYTNQTTLTTETKRTSTYLTGVGNCGNTSVTTMPISMYRTFDFSLEVGPVTYAEIAFSPLAAAGANLWARIKLASAIALIAGQQLRVKYTAVLTMSPIVATQVLVSPIAGWATATGYYQHLQWRGSGVNTSGAAANYGAYGNYEGEPNGASNMIVCAWTISLPFTFGSAISPALTTMIYNAAAVADTYATKRFYRDMTYVVPASSGNSTAINALVLGYDTTLGGFRWVYKIDSNQTKDNTHTLTVVVRTSATRVLA